MRKNLTKIFWNIEVWAVQTHVNLVDLVKSFSTNIYLQKLASIQPRTSRSKFADTIYNQPHSSVISTALSAWSQDWQAEVAKVTRLSSGQNDLLINQSKEGNLNFESRAYTANNQKTSKLYQESTTKKIKNLWIWFNTGRAVRRVLSRTRVV